MVTVVTKTIGPTGRDYTTFTLAEAAVESIATAEFGGTDLVANDGAIVFEADAGTYSENLLFSSSLTTDATRQVTYRPTAGGEHGGSLTQGVRIDGETITRDPFTALEGLVLYRAAGFGTHRAENGEGITYRNVIANTGSGGEPFQALNVVSARYENCVAHTTPGAGKGWRLDVLTRSGAIDLVNCTDMNPFRSIFLTVSNGYDAQVNIVNFLSLSPRGIYFLVTGGSTYTLTGSNNYSGSVDPFPAALQGSPYPITATTSFSTPLGAGDYAVYMGATGALADVTGNDVWQQGVGPGTNSDVPTTDINGVARSGATCNPGAFEADGFVAPTITTQTIGPVGRDYATFTLAEASLPAEDITFTNRAFVFEADAATYSESVSFSSSLTTDATRQVTYKPAAGSEHGGVFGAGVHISSTGTAGTHYDDFTRFEALSFVGSVVTFAVQAGIGWTVTGCLIHSTTAQYAFFATGNTSSSSRGLLENCVLKQDTNFKAMRFLTGPTGLGYYRAVNNTTVTDSYWEFESRGAPLDVELINNLNLGPGVFVNLSGGGSVIQSGSNNYSTSSRPWPVAIQGSPYPITATTSFSTPLGAGDYAVYMGSNGSLADVTGNDVWQQGVGPGTNSDVPITDINGVARSGASCNPGAFEADGFVAPTVITKTVGPVGRDYATPILLNADLANIPTGTDLTYENERIEGVIDGGEYQRFTVSSVLTADPTRNLTLRCAVGSEHGGVAGEGVIVYNDTTATAAVYGLQEHTTFDGLVTECRPGASGRSGFRDHRAGAMTFRNCMARDLVGTSNTGFNVDRASGPVGLVTIENCISRDNLNHFTQGLGTSQEVVLVNCTAIGGQRGVYQSGGTSNNWTIINNLFLGATQNFIDLGTSTTVSGSNNFTGSGSTLPAAIQGSPYPITATTSFSTPLGSGDYAVYMGSNGSLANVTGNDVWQQGVGPGSNASVPTTDINGVVRSGATCNPGAFEADGFVAPTVTTQTIGPVGRDFATFTLAEASLPSEDITFTNRAFVFEADEATYAENVTFQSSLTTDATRQVTYKPAAGSEHGGVPSTGVVLQSTTGIAGRDDHMTLRGICYLQTATGGANSSGIGLLFDQIIYEYAAGVWYGTFLECQSALFPSRWQNSVLFARGVSGGDRRGFIASHNNIHGHVEFVNCTVVAEDPAVVGFWTQTFGTGTCQLKLVNCVRLGASIGKAFNDSGSGSTVTGSNNFGSSNFPFPVAIQGSPYPVTASTAYDPGAGDFALYVSSTGQLLDSPHNDVIGGGVGPAANADVPTTGIVGRVRTGGTTNPGAFAQAQATRVIGKTIGPVGRDYATFTLAESAVESIATAETGSTDLVAGNARIEFLADAGEYDAASSAVYFQSSLTTDSTRSVTYKAAAGAGHGGNLNAGPIVRAATGVMDSFTVFDGLVLYDIVAGDHAVFTSAVGVIWRNCLASNPGGNACWVLNAGGTQQHPVTWENCVGFGQSSAGSQRVWQLATYSGDVYAKVINCTCVADGRWVFFTGGSTANVFEVEVTNFLALDESAVWVGNPTDPGRTLTGSNNFGGASTPFPVAIQGSPYPITATTNTDPGPGHFAIYDADTGALVNVAANTVWQRGVGPSVNSDVPTTGIAGFPRSGATANPGAFAASTALAATTNPVARFFTYKRPSTQVFNHHRRISCVFPDDGPSGNGNTFAVGVAARGFISPISRDCVAFFVYYTTDGAGVQTSLRLEVARLLGSYSQDTIAEAQPIAVIEKQAVGEAIPAGFNFPGQSHTVAFRVQTFSGATTPESAAEYTAFIDGTAVTFDTFYQSSTQDGTTKVVTHPAPAVGTTQGRAESFFWYATADRVDSSGSENYSLPQWSAWTQLAVDPDPLFDGDGETVGVLGEGTGTVNLSTAVEHVDWNISIQYELPRFDVPFASGHRYTSPRFANARRLITASATNVDKATMDLIVQFHAARKGIEDPFLFNFPVPATMASETYTVITVQFADQNGMVYRREAENTYSVQLNLLELL